MNYLKTITKQARQRGTTLIELSVVIAVLLLLVGVLFIGITAWKNGANTPASRGSAVYRHHRLEKRRKHSGLRRESLQYSKGGPRISKHEWAGCRRSAPGSYFDGRRLLGGDAGLSSRVCLHIYGHGPRSRNILHNLRGSESRPDGGKLS